MAEKSKGGLFGRFRRGAGGQAGERQEVPFGKDLNFAAAEAYRLLRTNLMFSLPDERRCRVIGVTSANAGEGKSTTALNLSYVLAEASKTVILVEADMRLPTISKRLGLKSSPGLSNLLVGLNSGKQVTQDAGIAPGLSVIAAGDIPPNPSELLGSDQMKTMLEVFSQMVDFIILDLPPINEVSDALVVSRLVDGIVMVVRQSYGSRRALADAMRQLDYAGAKVLGFVMTSAHSGNKFGYYKGYKSYRYNRRYGYGYGAYGYGYRSRHRQSANEDGKKIKTSGKGKAKSAEPPPEQKPEARGDG